MNTITYYPTNIPNNALAGFKMKGQKKPIIIIHSSLPVIKKETKQNSHFTAKVAKIFGVSNEYVRRLRNPKYDNVYRGEKANEIRLAYSKIETETENITLTTSLNKHVGINIQFLISHNYTSLEQAAKAIGIPLERLEFIVKYGFTSNKELEAIANHFKVSKEFINEDFDNA